MRVRDAADVSRTRGGVPRRAGGTCIAPAEEAEAAAVRAGGARAVGGAGPGGHLGREWRGRIRGPAARVRGSASSTPAAGRRRPARDDTRGRGCMHVCMHQTRGGLGPRPPGPRSKRGGPLEPRAFLRRGRGRGRWGGSSAVATRSRLLDQRTTATIPTNQPSPVGVGVRVRSLRGGVRPQAAPAPGRSVLGGALDQFVIQT